ncbi:ADP-ribosyltransferase [Pontibacter pudoricolor]|uniref:ADP-ribosyltransferase n=1 Tax=Pontibacter pudoricolor TaxID=2694930 RepID=UPI001390ABE3|nr:ADP-ribosyltransferase [Pontibacter pudoricolor]
MIDLNQLFILNNKLESDPSMRLEYSYQRGFMPWFIDYRSGSTKFEANLKGMKDYNLTEQEAFFLLAYTSSYSGWVNGDLRDGNKHNRDDIALFSDGLYCVLNKIPAFGSSFVYRMESQVADVDEELSWFERKTNSTFMLPYFLSTAKEDYKNSSVVWQIKTLEQGSLARDISNLTNNKSEKEVLFNRNAKFIIRGIDRATSYVYLEEVSPALKADFKLTGIYYKNIK